MVYVYYSLCLADDLSSIQLMKNVKQQLLATMVAVLCHLIRSSIKSLRARTKNFIFSSVALKFLPSCQCDNLAIARRQSTKPTGRDLSYFTKSRSICRSVTSP
jgi:hypothetical protein